MWCIGEHLNIFKNKLQKISLKISFACKNVFGKKDVQFFSKVIPLAPSYKFWPSNEHVLVFVVQKTWNQLYDFMHSFLFL
jgi:hypothetical protein